MKPCSRCGEVKEFDLFPRNAASPDGRYSLCKACTKESKAAYRLRPEVIERERARLAKSYADNRVVLLEKRKVRYIQNKPAERERQRRWLSENIEKQRKSCRDWAKNNPEKMRAIVARRRALLVGSGGRYTKDDISEMKLKQGNQCACCGFALIDFHVDHVIPLTKGGTNWPDNLQLLCPPCNRSKGNKLPHEFIEYRRVRQQGA